MSDIKSLIPDFAGETGFFSDPNLQESKPMQQRPQFEQQKQWQPPIQQQQPQPQFNQQRGQFNQRQQFDQQQRQQFDQQQRPQFEQQEQWQSPTQQSMRSHNLDGQSNENKQQSDKAQDSGKKKKFFGDRKINKTLIVIGILVVIIILIVIHLFIKKSNKSAQNGGNYKPAKGPPITGERLINQDVIIAQMKAAARTSNPPNNTANSPIKTQAEQDRHVELMRLKKEEILKKQKESLKQSEEQVQRPRVEELSESSSNLPRKNDDGRFISHSDNLNDVPHTDSDVIGDKDDVVMSDTVVNKKIIDSVLENHMAKLTTDSEVNIQSDTSEQSKLEENIDSLFSETTPSNTDPVEELQTEVQIEPQTEPQTEQIVVKKTPAKRGRKKKAS